jgi:predicted nucleic acid-binding protein
MRLFLDSSVLLAASASPSGASRLLFRLAPSNDWVLVATPYVLEEVLNNLPSLHVRATSSWSRLRSQLTIHDDILTLDRAAVFPATKDRPILFGALAWADVLLTLDRKDFGDLIGTEFYGLPVFTPGTFLQRERASSRLRGV